MLKANNSTLQTLQGLILLKKINFEIHSGKISYFNGPNGVGKTSLIKGILGLELKLNNLENTFKNYWYVPQVENKEFLLPIQLTDISNSGALLQDSERNTSWNKSSGGQRKKALIERALDQNCDLYIFDEPYNHLDSEAIFLVNQEFEKLVKKNKAILMVSHKEPVISEDHIVYLDVLEWK
jgi:ABC-type Mn2+/Zn2+ transport system ATPase subunit